MAATKEQTARRINVFEMGYYRVALWVNKAASGGSFWVLPTDDCGSKIEIGLDDTEQVVHASLWHEALELFFFLSGKRLSPSNYTAPSNDKYLFCFDHKEFSEAVFCAAEFCSKAWPVLLVEWKILQRNKKREDK